MINTFIYGTGNPAKLTSMRECLAPIGVKIIGLKELDAKIPEVDETGNSPLENARIKAHAYYSALKRPVFACDSGLYIDGLPEDEQPGVHVRMVNGKRLTDDEMIAHYAAIADKLGGKAASRYKNAICLIVSDDKIYEHFGDDISTETFHIVSKPHPKRVEGFPLDSLSVNIKSGEYSWADTEMREYSWEDGFRAFFRRLLGGIAIHQATNADTPKIINLDLLHRDKAITEAVQNGSCYIATSSGVIVGFALLHYHFFDYGFIDLLIVADEHRRQGIGSALLNYLFDICQTEKLFASTNESNLPMQGLLAKTGFVCCGQIDALDEGDPEIFYYRKRAVK